VILRRPSPPGHDASAAGLEPMIVVDQQHAVPRWAPFPRSRLDAVRSAICQSDQWDSRAQHSLSQGEGTLLKHTWLKCRAVKACAHLVDDVDQVPSLATTGRFEGPILGLSATYEIGDGTEAPHEA